MATNSVPRADSELAGVNGQIFLEEIEKQRMKLYNLLGVLHCACTVLREDQNDEASGAVELASDELQRILEALDRVNLLREARQGTAAAQEIRAASDAARGMQS